MRSFYLFYGVFAFINCNISASSENGNVVGFKPGSRLNAPRRPLADITNGSRLRSSLRQNKATGSALNLSSVVANPRLPLANITNTSRLSEGLKPNKATGGTAYVSKQVQDRKTALRDCLAALRLVVKGSEKKESFEPYQAFYENAYARYGDALKIPYSDRLESDLFKEKLILAFESLIESFGCLERKDLFPEPRMVYLHENLKDLSDSISKSADNSVKITKIKRPARRMVVSFSK